MRNCVSVEWMFLTLVYDDLGDNEHLAVVVLLCVLFSTSVSPSMFIVSINMDAETDVGKNTRALLQHQKYNTRW